MMTRIRPHLRGRRRGSSAVHGGCESDRAAPDAGPPMQDTESESEEYDETTLPATPFVDLETRPVSRFDRVHFVETVERAYQYFELKRCFQVLDLAMPGDSVSVRLQKCIFEELAHVQSFNKLDKEDIMEALKTTVLEIRYRRYCRDPIKYASYEEIRKFEKCPTGNTIFALVRKALEEGRVLDRDPEVEINNLKSRLLWSYTVNFYLVEERYRKSTVTFVVPHGTSAEAVKTTLTYARNDTTPLPSTEEDVIFSPIPFEVISCHMSSSGEQSAMAHVTFKEGLIATWAIGLAAVDRLRICDKAVEAIPTPYNIPPRDVNLPQNDKGKAVMDAYDKVEEELLADALSRYSKLIEKVEREMADTNNRKETKLERVLLEEATAGNETCATDIQSSEVVDW